jgi:hypothetical protein
MHIQYVEPFDSSTCRYDMSGFDFLVAAECPKLFSSQPNDWTVN